VRPALAVASTLAAVALSISPSPGEAQSALRVRVTDAHSGMPVRAALVTLDGVGQRRSVLTDSAGWAALPVSRPGSYKVAAIATAYLEGRVDVNVESQETRQIELKLAPDPIRPPPVSARANRVARLERAGFYDRMRESHGIFIDEEAISACGVIVLWTK
jgi:hypothetical protein